MSEYESKPTFREELTVLINKHSREGRSDTPDYILAEYMANCLQAFEKATLVRDAWWGHKHSLPEIAEAGILREEQPRDRASS